LGVAPRQGERLALLNIVVAVGENRLGEHSGREGENGADGELHFDWLGGEYSD
jgi:hypothetical protein